MLEQLENSRGRNFDKYTFRKKNIIRLFQNLQNKR